MDGGQREFFSSRWPLSRLGGSFRSLGGHGAEYDVAVASATASRDCGYPPLDWVPAVAGVSAWCP